MTYLESKKYRRLQKLGLVTIGLLFVSAVLLYERTQGWTAPAVMLVILSSIVLLNYRAAKMEVLTVLDISLPVYEQLIKKQQQRRVRR